MSSRAKPRDLQCRLTNYADAERSATLPFVIPSAAEGPAVQRIFPGLLFLHFNVIDRCWFALVRCSTKSERVARLESNTRHREERAGAAVEMRINHGRR